MGIPPLDLLPVFYHNYAGFSMVCFSATTIWRFYDSVLGKNYESKISTMMPLLNEKQKRIYLASEAIAIGRGGVTEVSRISGISRSVITAGIKDINDGKAEVLSADAPIRRKGAGRKPITETQPGIIEALEKLVCDSTFGDPMSPLLWTTKSIRKLADELVDKGFKIGYRKVGYLLEELGYSPLLEVASPERGIERPEKCPVDIFQRDGAGRPVDGGPVTGGVGGVPQCRR